MKRSMIVKIIIALLFLIFFVFPFIEKTTQQFGIRKPTMRTKGKQLYDPYPDTSEAPVLEFYWDGEIDLTEITRITPYGTWEGIFDGAYEPAKEMQFYLESDKKPIYAAAAGRVILNEKKHKSVTIAYGTHYGYTYLHIVDVLPDIKPGKKVEQGQHIGYTEVKIQDENGKKEAWWEIELNYKNGDVFRTLPPYEYFSQESQKTLDNIKNAAHYGYPQSGNYEPSWTVREGCSFIKYLDVPEWWSSGIRVGYPYDGDAEEEFLESIGLGWTVGDKYGRVKGPTDVCK